MSEFEIVKIKFNISKNKKKWKKIFLVLLNGFNTSVIL